MPEKEVDGLDYFTKVNTQISRLNRTVITDVKVDEDRIIRKLEDKMNRGLSRRTTESNGV